GIIAGNARACDAGPQPGQPCQRAGADHGVLLVEDGRRRQKRFTTEYTESTEKSKRKRSSALALRAQRCYLYRNSIVVPVTPDGPGVAPARRDGEAGASPALTRNGK